VNVINSQSYRKDEAERYYGPQCTRVIGLLIKSLHVLTLRVEGLRETRCVERSYQSMTLRCHSHEYMILIQSAHYARLPYDTPRFCEQPYPDNNRGDCVPHADADRDSVAYSCNTYHSCVLYTSNVDILSRCSQVNGSVYLNVDFDCLPREPAVKL